ncbi:MAG: hypothetical protein M5R40_29880 [Anaerolineae bacterium]|nr:hypothetical protein [Anaerolineae bacterium]
MAKRTFRPGQRCPKSGQYVIVSARTGKLTTVERTVVQGEPFPPTPKQGQGYQLADPTKTS